MCDYSSLQRLENANWFVNSATKHGSFAPTHTAAYPITLKRLQAGDTFMDVGCFLGGDRRAF